MPWVLRGSCVSCRSKCAPCAEECKYKWKCHGSHPGDEAREQEAKKEKSLVADYSQQQAAAVGRVLRLVCGEWGVRGLVG